MSLALRGVEYRQGGFALEANCEVTAKFTGLFGPSGAGKTTLLEIIAGLRRLRQGRIEFGGERMDLLPPASIAMA